MNLRKPRKGEVIKIAVLAVIITWIICFFIDYFRARQEKMPIFCLEKTEQKYEDGKVTTCKGLGYKMYKYERASIPIRVQFGPFFIKERTK